MSHKNPAYRYALNSSLGVLPVASGAWTTTPINLDKATDGDINTLTSLGLVNAQTGIISMDLFYPSNIIIIKLSALMGNDNVLNYLLLEASYDNLVFKQINKTFIPTLDIFTPEAIDFSMNVLGSYRYVRLSLVAVGQMNIMIKEFYAAGVL